MSTPADEGKLRAVPPADGGKLRAVPPADVRAEMAWYEKRAQDKEKVNAWMRANARANVEAIAQLLAEGLR